MIISKAPCHWSEGIFIKRSEGIDQQTGFIFFLNRVIIFQGAMSWSHVKYPRYLKPSRRQPRYHRWNLGLLTSLETEMLQKGAQNLSELGNTHYKRSRQPNAGATLSVLLAPLFTSATSYCAGIIHTLIGRFNCNLSNLAFMESGKCLCSIMPVVNSYYITHHYRIFDKIYAPLTVFVGLDNGKSLIRQQNIDKTNTGFVSPGHQRQNIM